MKLELLQAQDIVLNSCGRPVMPCNVGWVDLTKGLLYQKFLPGSSVGGTVLVSTEPKIVETPVPFLLYAISGYFQLDQQGAVLYRIRLPNGRFLHGSMASASESLNAGSFCLPLLEPIECSPGSKFYITVDNSVNPHAGASCALTLVFKGTLRFPLKGDPCGVATRFNEDWAGIPRYRADPNQNILAPEWRLGNQCCPETPAGSQDQKFTFCQPLDQIIPVPVSGDVVSDQLLQISSTCDFVARQIYFNQVSVTSEAAPATGILAVRIRTDDGYEMTDGFTLAGVISNALFPELVLEAGGGLYIDYQVLDGVGAATDTLNIQPILGGVKRWRKM